MVWLSPPPLWVKANSNLLGQVQADSIFSSRRFCGRDIQAVEATSRQPPPDFELGKITMKPRWLARGRSPDSDEYPWADPWQWCTATIIGAGVLRLDGT